MRQAVDPNAGHHLISGILFLILVMVSARLLDTLKNRDQRGRKHDPPD